MVSYVTKRLVETAVLLLVMSFLIYALIGLMPGDPIDMMISADPDITSEDAARLKALQGLDRPLVERYGNWLVTAFSGDFGYSRLYAQPVSEILGPRLLNTLAIVGTSLFLAIVIAFPAGILAATNAGGWFDRGTNFLAFAGFSIPSFWLGLILIIVFAVMLGWLPAGGTQTVDDGSFGDRVRYAILPVMTLTLLTAGTFIRFVRASMIDTLREPFIITARSKGLSPLRVIVAHALQHAMIPVTTVIALHFGTLFSGALVVETVFAYLGMGKLIYDSVLGNDFNLALAALMLATLVTLLCNLAADILYFWLDPRIEPEA
jgi:peptide/nickel transport system permease protein